MLTLAAALISRNTFTSLTPTQPSAYPLQAERARVGQEPPAVQLLPVQLARQSQSLAPCSLQGTSTGKRLFLTSLVGQNTINDLPSEKSNLVVVQGLSN